MMPAPCTCSRPTELPPPVHAMGHHPDCRYRQAFEEFHAAVQAGLGASPLLRERRDLLERARALDTAWRHLGSPDYVRAANDLRAVFDLPATRMAHETISWWDPRWTEPRPKPKGWRRLWDWLSVDVWCGLEDMWELVRHGR